MPRTLTLALLLLGGLAMSANALTLYVSPTGSDAAVGTRNAPFATLEAARDAIRTLKAGAGIPREGVSVELLPGVYELAKPFELSAEDSGTEALPIVYRAAPGAEVRLVGGKVVNNWQVVTDPQVLGVLEEGARGKVHQADLKALGITDYGSVVGGGLELFFGDEPMTVSRWPNEGFVKVVGVVDEKPVDVRGTKGDLAGKFHYEGDRAERWMQEKDVWLHGYWFWDWSDQRMKVQAIDPQEKLITLADPQHGYGYRNGQWYYALNALCEVDQPNEWYLDRETGVLYFYPPAPINSAKALVSVLPNLVVAKDASCVNLRGFTLEACRDTAVVTSGGTGNRVIACTIRNVGGQAVSMSGGTNSGVVGCDIYNTGKGGVSLDGGDRATLTPAGLFADNNHIHHFARWWRMYHAAVHLNGVGNRASHNLFDNAPHTAIFFGGNDHVMEFNEIHSVCYESNDAGAIYAGRNWSMRGTLLRYNYLHHINGFEGRGCVGMYLDDMFCGTEMIGNVFYKVTMAAFIGGGRDCTIENNIFVDCDPATHVDARAMGWAKYHTDGWVEALRNTGIHEGIKIWEPPYSTRWPELTTILDEDPWAPRGNLIARNVCWGGRWANWEGKAKPLLFVEDNLVQVDPHFVDYEHQNFQLKDDLPAYKLGFQQIPVEEIGLYDSPDRASWPVKSEVRPMQTPPPPPPRVPRGNPPVLKVGKAVGPVTVDGEVTAAEWPLSDAAKTVLLEQGIYREKARPTSRAWLACDGSRLYVAIENTVSAAKPVTMDNSWGSSDAVEIALKSPGLGDKATIMVYRGYPNGHFETSDEAGASARGVELALKGLQYAAKVVSPERWTCEFSIPLAVLGIDPAKSPKLPFNISVRKMASDLWLMWQGTEAWTWEVDQAGLVELGG